MEIDEGVVGVPLVWFIILILAGLSLRLDLHQKWCNDVDTQPHTSSWKHRSEVRQDVITKLGEKHQHFLPGSCHEMDISAALCVWNPMACILIIPGWGEQVSRATAITERVNGPKWWPHKLFSFQHVHYCGEDGDLECCLVCIHQS